MTDPLTFAIAVIALLATPGPTNTLLLTAGATAGRQALRLIPAEIVGYLISVLTIGLVIAPLTAKLPTLGIALRLLTASYLVVMAVRLWRHTASIVAAAQLIEFRHVFVTTLLNPKALLFALSIIPLRDPDATSYIVAFSILIAVVSLCWIGLGIGLSRGLIPERHRSLLPRLGAAIIFGFAGYLTWAAL